jgi:hypothetical protein
MDVGDNAIVRYLKVLSFCVTRENSKKHKKPLLKLVVRRRFDLEISKQIMTIISGVKSYFVLIGILTVLVNISL